MHRARVLQTTSVPKGEALRSVPPRTLAANGVRKHRGKKSKSKEERAPCARQAPEVLRRRSPAHTLGFLL